MDNKDLRIEELEAIIADLREYVVELEEKLDTLIYKLQVD